MDFTKESLRVMTRNYMDQHGLSDWSIRIGSARGIAGMCNFSRKQITISLFLANAMTTENVTDTILHEIAHALAGSKAGHGDDWKAVCVRIGAKPERCYDTSDIDPSKRHRFIGFCPSNEHNHKRYGRNRRSHIVCRCGETFVWEDTENPSSPAKTFRPTHVTALTQALKEVGATTTSDGVFYAPKGHVWSTEGMHYIDPTLPYYSEDDYGRERSISAKAKAILETVKDGVSPCPCGCIDWED